MPIDPPSPAVVAPWRALTAFHLRGGTRAALRAGTIALAAVIFVFGSAPEAGYTFMTFVRGVAGVGGRTPTNARVFVAAFALLLTALGARRVTLGATGWPRSLPVSAIDARRAAWIAATAAALSVLLFVVLVAPVLMLVVYRAPIGPARLATLPLLVVAAGAASLRVERWPARAVAGAALYVTTLGTWPSLAIAAGALLVWDRVAGGLAAPAPPRRVHRVSHARRLPPRLGALALAARWAWRAASWRAVLEAWIAPVVPVALTYFVRANNADLSPSTSGNVARVGAAIGVVLSVATMAAALLARRPPWPWSRALPWSSAERVMVDAVVVGAPAVVVGIAAAIVHGPGVVIAAAASLAIAATAAAGALRVGGRRQTGAVGETLVVAVPAVVLLSLWPVLGWGAPLLVFALGVHAARRDRRSADAVRWNELRHDVAGDVAWIARA